MTRRAARIVSVALLGTLVAPLGLLAEETVATAVYSRIGNGYRRERLADGRFRPEFYALGNGGKIAGTTTDPTMDRVGYPEVATMAMRLLAQKNYHYARNRAQAKLLVVVQWGCTLAPNGTNYAQLVSQFGAGLVAGTAQGMGSLDAGMAEASEPGAQFAIETLLMENRARDEVNERNAQVLGYLDDLNDSNDIRRWAGGGDRYNDLIADVEESRYYLVISAYDFPELIKNQRKKLLWQTRASVRAPGNRFDDSMAAIMKSAAKYFGEDSGRLVRGEEQKRQAEMGELKFLGEATESPQPKEK